MAFVVEDGTGVLDANAYVTVAFADSYFEDRNQTSWSGSDLEKQGWIVRATDYVETRFYGQFRGYEAFPGIQALQFPRYLFGYPSVALTTVALPINLQKAVCEYALRAKTAPLAPDPVVDPSGFQISGTHKKVGPIEKDVEYATRGSGSTPQILRPYPAADMLLAGLVKSTQGRVIRS